MPMKIKTGVRAPSSVVRCEDCPLQADCQFDQPKRGGFKGKGQKYVGYRIITDAVEDHGAKEDFMRCTDFVATMQTRMNMGRIAREQGFDADVITIIAQEGEEIERRTSVGVTSLGEVVRPQAEIIEDLKAAGYKIAPDHAVAITRKDVTYSTKVPRFAEESKRINSYAQKLLNRQSEMETTATDVEEKAWQEAKKRQKQKDEAQQKIA